MEDIIFKEVLFNAMRWFKLLKDKMGWKRKKRPLTDPETDLKNKLSYAVAAIQIQCKRLDLAINKLKEKDRYYYLRILNALRLHDKKKAIIYANELSEVRKALKSVNFVKLALEQIAVRLLTLKDIATVVKQLSPAIKIINSVKKEIAGVLPQAEEELSSLSDQLTRILVDASQMENFAVDLTTTDLEAEKILSQAEEQVERELKEKLPPIPSFSKEALKT